jgi:starch-binding outer membrane protein, SusD/RagB family
MKRLTRFVLGGLALAGVAAACENFLENPPQGALDELTLANRAGVEATLVGAYRPLGAIGDWAAAPSNWAYGNIAADDAYKGSEPSDQPDANFIEYYDWGGSGAHNYLNGKWTNVYDGVARVNATLRLLDQVVKASASEIPEAVARSIKGEAIFLRAHYHFEAWRFWGNVPYYTETDTDFRKPNQPTDQVLAAILKDLDEAISLLPATSRNGDKGRVNQWTAKAYKGRVQVLAGQYQAGLTTLRDVRANGPYRLEPNFYRVWSAFREVQNGPETILAYQASVNDGESDGQNSNYGERLNFPYAGSPLGCCGFNQPSQNLVNFFRVDAGGLPLAISVGDMEPLSAGAAWNAPFDANFTAAVKEPVDPRLDWTVGRDGVPYKDWGIHDAPGGWVRDISYGGFYNGKKHVQEKASGTTSNVGWNPAHLNSMNWHIFRYADLLLLLAEAEVEAGGAAGLENARQIVNEIRRRAGVVAQGPGTSAADIAVPIDDPRITWAVYRIGEYPSFPSQAYARTAVRYERRLELAMEGQRLFDLRRWNEFQPVLNEYVQEEQTRRPHKKASVQVADRHKLFPIPNRQLELSTVEGASQLTQNPGW